MSDINFFAQTNHRNITKKFGIKAKDRLRHQYLIGKTGTGKSTLLENLILQDVYNGNGVAFIDPHGYSVEHILERIPKSRMEDVIYINPSDLSHSVGLNLLACSDPDRKHLVANEMLAIFKKLWDGDQNKPEIETYTTNTILTILEKENATLLDLLRMLSDSAYRQRMIAQVSDPLLKRFWSEKQTNQKRMAEMLAPIENRVRKMLGGIPLRNTFSQAHKTLDMRRVMDDGQILLVNLSKGQLGELEATIFGSIIVTIMQTATLARAPHSRPFYLFIDEFHNFVTDSFLTIYSEARKYGLGLTVAHQYLEQLENNNNVLKAIIGNIGSMICFTLGSTDAQVLAKEFAPEFDAEHLNNLEKYHIALKLMVDGMTTRPFSATTLPPLLFPKKISRAKILERTLQRTARSRRKIETEIKRAMQPKQT